MTQNKFRRDLKIGSANFPIPAYVLSLLAVSVGAALSVPASALELSVYGVGHLSADSIDTDADSSGYIYTATLLALASRVRMMSAVAPPSCSNTSRVWT